LGFEVVRQAVVLTGKSCPLIELSFHAQDLLPKLYHALTREIEPVAGIQEIQEGLEGFGLVQDGKGDEQAHPCRIDRCRCDLEIPGEIYLAFGFQGIDKSAHLEDVGGHRIPCRMIRPHSGCGIGDPYALHCPRIIGRHGLTLHDRDPFHAQDLPRHRCTAAYDLAQRFRYWQFVIWKSIDEKKAEHVADVLIDADVFVVSTLISDEVRRPGERRRELDFLWENLPKSFQHFSSNPGIALNWSDEDYANFALSFKKEKTWFRDFFRKGGKIAAGTDSPVPFIIPGYSLHEELRQLVSTGIPAMDVLKTATANAAELLGMQDQLGSIEEGRLADLVILEGNPLDDIKNTLRISKVMKSGKVYAPADLRKEKAPPRLR